MCFCLYISKCIQINYISLPSLITPSASLSPLPSVSLLPRPIAPSAPLSPLPSVSPLPRPIALLPPYRPSPPYRPFPSLSPPLVWLNVSCLLPPQLSSSSINIAALSLGLATPSTALIYAHSTPYMLPLEKRCAARYNCVAFKCKVLLPICDRDRKSQINAV